VAYFICWLFFLLLARYVCNVAKRSIWGQCNIEDRPTDDRRPTADLCSWKRLPGRTSNGHYTSHDTVSVVRTTFKVYGKRQTLTLSQPKTPEPIVTKFKRRDNVVNAYHEKNFGLNPPKGFCSQYRWNIHPSCSKFTKLFWSLNSPTGKSFRPIFTLNMSNDAVLRKKVPFYCYKIMNFIFHLFIRQIQKKYSGAYWKN